ncbi:putative tRNA dimethylallyltransferase, mitochondrial [Apostichopus japonicus]|uniref:Putative tRNA dimethylallyltransferase, mitochondrial n=1 Tax=Stichopus japonicus TaxID=307972 RepID=A0A2G8L6D2_STIJA|nr:putative tRNA dimethylallyltransferase, mitochondrial [Apostichopus japonicus]
MAASMCQNIAKQVPPVVVILGATGTGKSKLAVEIAKTFQGDIISADSMQVYKGLDIITNKVTEEEQDGVPHHLLGVVSPLSRFTIVDFRDRAVSMIDELLRSHKMPVIVGGTNYYIEALLWKVLIEQNKRYNSSAEGLLIEDVGIVDKLKLPMTSLASSSVGFMEKISVLEENGEEQDCDRKNRSGESPVGVYQDLLRTLREISKGPVRGPSWCKEEHPIENVDKRKGVLRREVNDVNCENEMEMLEGKNSTLENKFNPSNLDNCTEDEKDATEEVCYQSKSLQREEKFVGAAGTDLGHKDCDSNPIKKPLEGSCISTGQQDEFTDSEGLSFSVEDLGDDHDDGFAIIDVRKSSSSALHRILSTVDPDMALRLHPNDKRKIIRSLQVYQQHGIPHSQLLESQRTRKGGPLGGPLRYQNPHAPVASDRTRCSDELYEQGIFQSIGFKEFHPYLILPDHDKETDLGKRLLLDCIERLKVVTKQYARKQLKWIRNRFLKRPGENVPSVYGLASTDPTRWDELVYQPAVEILRALMEGEEPSYRPLERQEADITPPIRSRMSAKSVMAGYLSVHSNGKAQGIYAMVIACMCVYVTPLARKHDNSTMARWIEVILGHVTSRRHKKRVAGARKRTLNHKWAEALAKRVETTGNKR